MKTRISWIWMVRGLVAMTAALLLSSCVADRYGQATYDPNGNVFLQRQQASQRYGHGGTHSPRSQQAKPRRKKIAQTKPRTKPRRKVEQPKVTARREQQKLQPRAKSRVEPKPKPKPIVNPDPEPVVSSTPPPKIQPDLQPIEPLPEPEPEPKVVAKPTPKPTPKPAPKPESIPYGVPVPGKSGMVYSPYAKTAGYVDVRGIGAGKKVKCPYSQKVFRVP